MPVASIVVPAFNAEKTLPETLSALLCQTFRDFEIIVVNDGSADRTSSVAHTFTTDRRLHVIEQANRGLAGARNAGIAAARGRYIGFCDADDLWVPEKLEAHIRHLDTSPDVGISFSGSYLIDEFSRPTGMSQKPRLRGITTEHVLCRNPIGNGSAPVMRLAAISDLAWRPRFETAHDWVFDETFRRSLLISDGDLSTFWTRPGAAILLTLNIALILSQMPFIKNTFKRLVPGRG